MTKGRRAVCGLRTIVLCALLVFFCGTLALAEGGVQEIALNDWVELMLSETPAAYGFTVPSNSVYTFKSFGGEGARAQLLVGQNRQLVAEGEGFSFMQRLVAGRQYTLLVSGESGTARVEIMRDALGRSYHKPLVLENLREGYTKAVARAGDVHWYRFSPTDSGLYMIATRGAVATEGLLMDEWGAPLPGMPMRALPYDRNFAVQLNLRAGATYYLRVNAHADETGRYTLRFIHGDEDAPMPESIELSATELELEIGERAQLRAQVMPADAMEELLLVSSNPRIATVRSTGQVVAVSEGECEIVALGFGSAYASCVVKVRAIALEAVEFEQKTISMAIGERLPLRYALVPEGAQAKGMQLHSSDELVVSLDTSRNVLGKSVGTAQITALSEQGEMLGSMQIKVTEVPIRRRALVFGEQHYLDGRVRIGAVNTTQGIADLLRRQSFDGASYEVTMRMDTGRAAAISAIQEVFSDVQPGDISLFSINCHGGYENGTPYLEFHDGSRLTAQGLEAELRKIPGTVVVIIDCCNSGAFISRVERTKFSSRMLAAFGTDRSGSFGMSKYRVICSSSAEQNSYRISPERIETEGYLSTALARALCLAGGWDIVEDRAMSMKADADKNGQVTLEEVYQYTYKRVKLFLGKEADLQDVQIYPRGSQFAIFSE